MMVEEPGKPKAVRYATVVIAVVAATLLIASIAVLVSHQREPSPVEHLTAYEQIPQANSEELFVAAVLRSPRPVLVDFFATWCEPCKEVEPTVGKLSLDYKGRVGFIKVDGDQANPLLLRYGIEGYPTAVVFAGGEVVGKVEGAGHPDSDYTSLLDRALKVKIPQAATAAESAKETP